MTIVDAGNQAEQLLNDLGVNRLPIHPQEICAAISTIANPVEYVEMDFQTDALLGMATSNKVLVNSRIRNSGRKNFTGAHEIGHVVMHITTGVASRFECNEDAVLASNNTREHFEIEADRFASSLLMPRILINEVIQRSDLTWAVCSAVANHSETSLLAAAKRVVSISPDPVALVVHRNRRFWQFEVSRSFPFYIGKPSIPRDVEQKELASGIGTYEEFEICDACDWVDADEAINQELCFSSVKSSKHGISLTLLQVNE